MWNAECGIDVRVRARLDLSTDIPHSAFRIPHSMTRPVVQLYQLLQGLDPPLPRSPDQRPQDLSRGEGIPKRAMACRVLDAEVRRHLVESTVTKLGSQAAREADRAEGLAAGRGDAGQGVFGREEAPVEAGVVGDEHGGVQRSSETGHDIPETGPTGNHAVGDAGEPRHPQGNRGPRVEQRLEGEMDGSALEDRHRYLEDPSAVQGPHAGRFDVHDGEAGVLEGL